MIVFLTPICSKDVPEEDCDDENALEDSSTGTLSSSVALLCGLTS
jgi:hypothetical protein